MRVERLTDWGAVGEATWNGLVARSATPLPFSTWQFQTAWWRLLGEGRLHLLGVQDAAADWVAMLPLYDAGSTPASLRLVGGVDVADYLDLVAVAGHEEAAWKALLGALPAGGPALDLRPVPAASPTVTLLPGLAAAAGRGCRIERDETVSGHGLARLVDDFLAALSKHRHELRRDPPAPRTTPGPAWRSRVAPRTSTRASTASSTSTGTRRSARSASWTRAWKGSSASRRRARRDVGPRCGSSSGRGPAGRGVRRPRVGRTVGLYNSGFRSRGAGAVAGLVLLARTIEDAIRRGFRRTTSSPATSRYSPASGSFPTTSCG